MTSHEFHGQDSTAENADIEFSAFSEFSELKLQRRSLRQPNGRCPSSLEVQPLCPSVSAVVSQSEVEKMNAHEALRIVAFSLTADRFLCRDSRPLFQMHP